MTVSVSVTVNGTRVGPVDIPDDLMMLEFLQEYLNLTGTRFGCGQGVCRACTIVVDGEDGSSTALACVTGAVWFDGRSVRTVEGHATRDAEGRVTALSPVQQAFLDHVSFQCSYCTPGFVNAGTALLERLERTPVSRDRIEDVVLEALDGNICRCTGYVRYLTALRDLILASPGLTSDGEPS
jgi:aerobic-type carbon monoxide dehydrogenase small subunit (CoxS/CutS family)